MTAVVDVRQWVHVCIVCSDLDRTLDFYTRVLGASLVEDVRESDLTVAAQLLAIAGDARCRWAFLTWGGSTVLEVQQYLDPGRPVERTTKDIGVARIALRVPDADAAMAAVRAECLQLVGTIDTVFADRGGVGRKGFSVRDPDGLLVELLEYSEHREDP